MYEFCFECYYLLLHGNGVDRHSTSLITLVIRNINWRPKWYMQYTDLYKPHGGKNPLIPEVGINLNLRTL